MQLSKSLQNRIKNDALVRHQWENCIMQREGYYSTLVRNNVEYIVESQGWDEADEGIYSNEWRMYTED